MKDESQITISSIEIANVFGKRHRDVMETIRRRVDVDDAVLSDVDGRKHYRIKRKGFIAMTKGFRQSPEVKEQTAIIMQWFGEMNAENSRAKDFPFRNNPIPGHENSHIPVTEIGTYRRKPWYAAKSLHKELYAQLEALYKIKGGRIDRERGSYDKNLLYECEEFAVLMDYLLMKMPRYTEAMLKLQIAALSNL